MQSRSSAIRGRDTELAALDESLERVAAGAGFVALLEGDAGLGKSRLIEEAADRARRLSIRAGVATTEPFEGASELAPLLRALFDGPSPLLDRVDLDRPDTSPEQRYWLLQDLEALIERSALRGPLLICLDDLHWTDAGTVAALRALPRRLASLPVGWILATRPDQGSPALRRALDQFIAEGALRLRLRPLDDDAVAEVAEDVLDAMPDAGVMQLASDAGGNPFLLVELFRGLTDEALVSVHDGRAALATTRLPDRVHMSMRGRLARLDVPARQAATVAASLGRAFSVSELSLMLETTPASLVAPIQQLIDGGILREQGDRLSFLHDLTREGVRQAAPPALRRALDRQATDVLLAQGALPVDVATQLAHSAEPGDDAAIATLREAAEALGKADPGAAADLSRRALELAPANHSSRGALIGQTAVLLHAAARSDEAKAFADQHLRGVLPTADEAEICLSIASLFALAPDERVAANRRALALPGLSERDRARHLARLTYNLYQSGLAGEARDLMSEALKAVSAAGDEPSAAVLHHIQGSLLYAEGRYGEALATHEEVMREGFGPSEITRWLVALLWHTELLATVDRLDEALEMMAEGISAARKDRQGWAVDYFETWRGCQMFTRGRLADAAAALDGRFELDGPNKVVAGVPAAGLATLGRVAIHTGDQRRRRAAREIAEQIFVEGAPLNRRRGAWLLALDAMADGAAERALEFAKSPGVGQLGLLPMYPIDVTDDAHMVRIALACNDTELARETAQAAERRARLNPGITSIQAAAAHARGLADGEPQKLAGAVRLYERVQRPLALASAAEDLGVVAMGDGDRETGLDAFDRALVLYAEAGAEWDARRVRGRLRAHGVRRRLTSGQRPKHGWASLTDSELVVARLVAGGLTNREVSERLFVSPHTVNGHLRSTFAKLNISSRVELVRLVSRHDQPQ